MAWKPATYRIVAGLIDLRAFDDAGVAFVRKNIDKLKAWVDLDDIEYQLRAMHEMNRGFSAELILVSQVQAELEQGWVAILQGGTFTTRRLQDSQDLAGRLSGGGLRYRLAGAGYTLDRLAQVEEIAKRRHSGDIGRLIEMLRVANQPTPSEQELRQAIYDALSWHKVYDVREMLFGALATEPDEIAELLIDVLRRQDVLDDLPQMIDDAWHGGDQRLAKRLLAALVKSDDDRKHLAWARSKYPSIVRELGW